MGENKDKNTIFPLSPDSTLKKENAKVYFGFLKGALEAERIHNIAVTGGFGAGKSSLIRSYEKEEHPIKATLLRLLSQFKRIPHKIWTHFFWRNSVSQVDADREPLNRFLYVSVGEYASNAEEARKQTGAGTLGGNPEQGEDTTTIRAIERRLLLQLFARFRRADLPQSNFRLIPEAWTKRLWLIAILLGGFVFSALLLSFHKQLGALLVAVNSMEGGPKCGALIMAFLVKYKTLLRLLLSAYCIGFSAAASAFLCIRILPRIHFHAFTVKGANAELAVEREAAESYLDLYSMELVYCLEKIARKIDHVVVFEDLDRLDPGDCLYILTRLREINNLVNLRLQKKCVHLCFIYSVNDNFLGTVQHEKFFDYILPVIPEMNKRSAAVLFANKIKEIDNDVLKEFSEFETVASCLSDYRLQNTILNEYQVLLKLYTSTKPAKTTLNNSQKKEILAFVIYKNCWPGDYHALREDESQVFTSEGVKCPEEFKGGKYGKLLKVLAAPENHLLTLHSLYYVNFDEKMLADMYSKHWEAAIKDSKRHKEIIAELDTIQKDEAECLRDAQKFFKNLNHLIDNTGGKPLPRVELFRAVVRCMVRCNQSDNSWFFDPNSKLSNCLKLLAELKDDEDETLKVSFFINSFQHHKTKDIYSASQDDLNKLAITASELRELCRGRKDLDGAKIYVSDSSDKLEELVSKIRSEFKDSGTTPYFEKK